MRNPRSKIQNSRWKTEAEQKTSRFKIQAFKIQDCSKLNWAKGLLNTFALRTFELRIRQSGFRQPLTADRESTLHLVSTCIRFYSLLAALNCRNILNIES
jgi:hypothetical protein